jgi:hypothetical protein
VTSLHSASDTEGSETDKDEQSSASDNFLHALDTNTRLLLYLCPSLDQAFRDVQRQPQQRASLRPPMAFHVTEAARSYVLQVHDKFREADMHLVERLGEANWQRYERLRAVKSEVEEPIANSGHSEPPKSVFQPLSLFQDSGLGTSLPTHSQRAPSVASHSSFASSIADHEHGRLQIPKTPDEVAARLPFTCFICQRLQTNIWDRIGWK